MKSMRQTMWNGLATRVALLAIASTTAVLADTIEMRDGTLVQGMFMGGTQTTVRVQTQTETKVIPITAIVAVTFDRKATAAPTAAAPAAVAPPEAAAAKPSLAAGSKIQVRITATVDSTVNKVGSKFTGVLMAELRAGDVVLAPAGALVAGELAAGTAPQPALQLVLTGITINGQVKPLATDDVIAVSAPMTKKNLKSTAFGAALGAIGGGTEGAAKGAGGGALAAVIVKGDRVNVPATSVLEFQLKTAFTP